MKIATIDYRTINRMSKGQLGKRKRLLLVALNAWEARRKLIALKVVQTWK